jgi:hypothetical protein
MERDSRIHVLQVLSGPRTGQQVPLLPGVASILGRSSEVDHVFADDTVSRKHVRFHHARGRVWVRDLGSRNGTLVNGASVALHCLRDGDRIAVGANLLRVELVPASQISSRSKAPDASAPSMTGTLSDIPLADVLQWLSQSRKTGTLVVRGAREGALCLRQGQIYWARIEGRPGLRPDKALLRMLAWGDGTFGLDASRVEEVEGELTTSLEHVLMEAARQQDEIAHIGEKHALPGEDAVVSLVFPSGMPWRELTPNALDLVQHLAGGGSWQEALDRLPHDDVTLVRELVALSKAGVVRW